MNASGTKLTLVVSAPIDVAVDRALGMVAQPERRSLEDAERPERGDDRGQAEDPDQESR